MVVPASYRRKRLNRLFRFGWRRSSKKEDVKKFIRYKTDPLSNNFVLLESLEDILSEFLQVQNPKQDLLTRIDQLLTALERADERTQHKFLDKLKESRGFAPLSFIYFVNRCDVIMGIVLIALLTFVLTGVGLVSFPPSKNSPTSENDLTTSNVQTTTTTTTLNPEIIIELETNGTTKFSLTTPTTIGPETTSSTTTTTTTTSTNKLDPEKEEESSINNVCHARGGGTLTKPPLEKRHKCPIGTCSYDEFKMDAPPGTPRCDEFRNLEVDLGKAPGEKDRAELKIIKCENKCGYYSLLVNDFSVFSQQFVFLSEKFPQSKTLIVTNDGVLCEADGVNEDSFTIQWKSLRWFKISNITSECSEIYKAIATWSTPRLEMLGFDQSFISYSDADYITEILKTNSHINTLMLTNITLCVNCQIFDSITIMPSLKKIALVWRNPNSIIVQQQTTKLLTELSPNAIDVISNAELSIDDLDRLAQSLLYLEKAHLVVSLDNDQDDLSVEFSLATISGFCSLTDLTINLTVKEKIGAMDQEKVTIVVKDFEELRKNSMIKKLTVVSDVYELKVPDGVHKYCLQLFSLPAVQNPPYIFKCFLSL